MMNARRILRHAVAALLLLPAGALACSCRPGTLSERVALAEIVLIAVVADAEPLRQVTLKPKEFFKGRAGKFLKIRTGESDCDFFLPPVQPRVGDAYLLYVGRSKDRFFASRCQNSGLVAERKAELAELRKWRRSRP